MLGTPQFMLRHDIHILFEIGCVYDCSKHVGREGGVFILFFKTVTNVFHKLRKRK